MTDKQLRAAEAILIVMNVLLKDTAEAHQTLIAVDMLLSVCGGVPNDLQLPILKQFLEQI